MKRLAVYTLIILGLILLTTPLVFANCQIECEGCRHTIKVIPIDSTKTGDPIVTQTPANLMIFHTGKGPINNVWLLIVLNKPTYDNLDKITINSATFMTKEDFELVDSKKIPPVLPNPSTGYPGSLCQYNIAAIKDKMNEIGNPVYYGMKAFLGQITETPTYFTLAIELTAPANLKALILALGRINLNVDNSANIECARQKPFNACTSFSNSTFIVPEITTIALAAAPFSALGIFGVYVLRRRKK